MGDTVDQLTARHADINSELQNAAQRRADLQADVAAAQAEEQAALTAGEFAAAAEHRVRVDELEASLPAALAAEAARKRAVEAAGAELQRAQHIERRDGLVASIAAQSMDLDALLLQVRADAASAASSLRAAMALEDQRATARSQLNRVQVELGEVGHDPYAGGSRPAMELTQSDPTFAALAKLAGA